MSAASESQPSSSITDPSKLSALIGQGGTQPGLRERLFLAIESEDNDLLRELLNALLQTNDPSSISALAAAWRRAARQQATSAMQLILSSASDEILMAMTDARGRTVAHWACLFVQQEQFLSELAQRLPQAFELATMADSKAARVAANRPHDYTAQSKVQSVMRSSFSVASKVSRISKSNTARYNRRLDNDIGEKIDAETARQIELATASGETAIHWAARFQPTATVFISLLKRLPEMAKVLSEVGKHTPLHLVCRSDLKERLEEILPLLLPQFVQELQFVDGNGESAVHIACKKLGEAAALQFLQHLPLNSLLHLDASGASPIDCAIAADANSYELKKELFQRLRHSIRKKEPQHATSLLHCIVRMPLSDIKEELANFPELRAPLRFGKFTGETVLHIACLHGNAETICLLQQQLGLSLADTDDAGRSCVDFAYERGHQSAVFAASHHLDDQDFLQLVNLVDPCNSVLSLSDVSPEKVRASYQSLAGFQSVELVMFMRAFELDDSKIFRSIIQLDLLTPQSMMEITRELLATAKLPKFAIKSLSLPAVHPIDIALACDKVSLVQDFVISRQTDVLPMCLRFLIEMREQIFLKKGKYEQLLELRNRLVAIAANALDAMHLEADEEDLVLLFDYIRGGFCEDLKLSPEKEMQEAGEAEDGVKMSSNNPEIDGGKENHEAKSESVKSRRGPVFDYLQQHPPALHCGSIISMIEAADCDELYGTSCMAEFVDRQWGVTADFLLQRKGKDNEILQGDQCFGGFTYSMKFLLHSISFVACFVFLAWYIISFKDILLWIWPDIVMLLIFSSLLSDEIFDFWQRRKFVPTMRLKRVLNLPMYFSDTINLFDLFALLFMLAGIITKYLVVANVFNDVYSSQMLFATAHLLLGFRAVAFLRFFSATGPLIAMIETLIVKDLGPFLAILVIIIASFGVFAFVLLYPEGGTSRPMYNIFTLPVNVMFGNYEAVFETSDTNVTITPNTTGKVVYERFLLFLFLALVNIVMINLLIALFSESVKNVKDRAYVLWRKARWEMLTEFRRSCLLPPPLSVLEFIAAICWPALRRYGKAWSRFAESKGCCSRFVHLLPLLPCCLPISCCCFVFGKRCNRCCKNDRVSDQPDEQNWSETTCTSLPSKYRQFLRFQANIMRSNRSQLLHRAARFGDSESRTRSGTNSNRGEAAQENDLSARLATLEASNKRMLRNISDNAVKLTATADAVNKLSQIVQQLKEKIEKDSELQAARREVQSSKSVSDVSATTSAAVAHDGTQPGT